MQSTHLRLLVLDHPHFAKCSFAYRPEEIEMIQVDRALKVDDLVDRGSRQRTALIDAQVMLYSLLVCSRGHP